MTPEDPFDQWGIEETVAGFVNPYKAAEYVAQARAQTREKVLSARDIEKLKKKRARKLKRASRLASTLLAAALFVGCTTTHIRGDAGSVEPESMAPFEAEYRPDPLEVPIDIEDDDGGASCETPCGDACCPERAFCYEGACKCFAGIDECGDICCPEDTPVCVEGICEP